jgi:hypothetical protein
MRIHEPVDDSTMLLVGKPNLLREIYFVKRDGDRLNFLVAAPDAAEPFPEAFG